MRTAGRGGRSMTDGEALEFPGGRVGFGINSADVAVHLLAQTLDNGIHLPVVPFKEQFDAAIIHISNIAEDVVTHRDVLSSITEAHALNAPIKVKDATMHCAVSERPSFHMLS